MPKLRERLSDTAMCALIALCTRNPWRIYATRRQIEAALDELAAAGYIRREEGGTRVIRRLKDPEELMGWK